MLRLVRDLRRETEQLGVTSQQATLLALVWINGLAVRFTMGAFALRIDEVAILIGCGVGRLLGLVGAIPPAIRSLKLPIVEGLKAS